MCRKLWEGKTPGACLVDARLSYAGLWIFDSLARA